MFSTDHARITLGQSEVILSLCSILGWNRWPLEMSILPLRDDHGRAEGSGQDFHLPQP